MCPEAACRFSRQATVFPCDSRFVTVLALFLPSSVYERRLAHIGNAYYHHTQRLLSHPFFIFFFLYCCQQFKQLIYSAAFGAVHGKGVIAFAFKVFYPLFAGRLSARSLLFKAITLLLPLMRSSMIGLRLETGILASTTSITDYHLEVFFYQLPGLFHVPGIPVDIFHVSIVIHHLSVFFKTNAAAF